MNEFRNRRICRILSVLVFLSVMDNSVEGMLKNDTKRDKSFEINQPLSEWPEASSLSREEKRVYDSTWDITKKLEDNQIALVRRFILSCCDFSFRSIKTNLSGIHLGVFSSGEGVVFIDKETHMRVTPDSEKVIFFNDKDQGRELGVFPTTSMIKNIKPINFQEWMVCELERYIQRFVEDSVGCEMLRMSIAKYEARQRGLPKIGFIPIDSKKIDLAYTSGTYVWKYARKNGQPNFYSYARYCNENKFIIFSPKWFNLDHKGLILKLRDKETSCGDDAFSIDMGIMPREMELMYQIINAMHVEEDNDDKGTHVIEKRDEKDYFCGNLEEVGSFLILNKRLNASIFKNDRIYRVMYGLTKKGFDLINESSYLAHRYNFIRPAYLCSKKGMQLNGKRLNRKVSFKFLKSFLKTNGDFDLYKYYLSSQSSIKYPEFGVGKYRCSDVNFEKEKEL